MDKIERSNLVNTAPNYPMMGLLAGVALIGFGEGAGRFAGWNWASSLSWVGGAVALTGLTYMATQWCQLKQTI